MNKYWCSIPNAVRKSKILTAEEKDLYYELCERLTEGGFCKASNTELANALDVSPKTITTRLSSLERKNAIRTYHNPHLHKRWIYINYPGKTNVPNKPQDKELEESTRRIRESMKKAIVFATIDFEVLIQKMLESPYLHEVEDNNTQFVLTLEQIDFIYKIKNMCNKQIDCQIACYPNINLPHLYNKIRESEFLLTNSNLNLKWLLEHASEIMKDKYKQYYPRQEEHKKGFQGRNNTPDYWNSLFNNPNDI